MNNLYSCEKHYIRDAAARSHEPTVSIAIITYNHVSMLQKAVESVLMQIVNFSCEILIGDDASTDGTSDLVREYALKYPELVIPFVRNTNVGAAKNAYLLLQHAQGEYIASLEGDDYWTDPYKLQKQVDFLETHPRYIGCTHRLKYVDANGEPLNKAPHWIGKKQVFTLRNFNGMRLPGQASSLVRRNIFLHPEHDYSILFTLDPMISDRTSALIFLLQGDFYRLEDTMGVYRYVAKAENKNLTSQLFQKEDRIEKDFQMACHMEEYAKTEFSVNKSFAPLKRELYAKACLRAVRIRSSNVFNSARRMRRSEKKGYRYLLALPFNAVKLVWRRLRGA